jgi:hypothetical protein
MDKKSKRYVVSLTAISLILAAVACFCGESLLKQPVLITWSLILLGVFYLYELLTVFVITRKRKEASAKQLVNIYLGLKAGRLIISLIFAATYVMNIKVEIKRFMLVFVLIYLVYLLCDTLYMANTEKKYKKQ